MNAPRLLLPALVGAALAACTSDEHPTPLDAANTPDRPDAVTVDAPDVTRPDVVAPDVVSPDVVSPDVVTPDVVTPDVPRSDGGDGTWCSIGTDLPGVTLAPGFCLRRFASLTSPRMMQFTPNGDLLVTCPTTGSPGGSGGGPGAIVVLSDDDHDGTAEPRMFATSIPDVHGITLGGGFVYFTTERDVFRTPYATGQRAENVAGRQSLSLSARWGTGGRWTHGIARSQGGTLYGSRAEYSSCTASQGGEIYTLAMGGVMNMVADGLRNPMYMRCHYRDELCMAAELGEDQQTGAREKLIRLRSGHFGYPCCYTTNLPMSGMCASVTGEDYAVTLGDTPFGFDWERGTWPAPWRDGMYVALHGSFYTGPWLGAGIVYVPTDPSTHLPTGERRYLVQGFAPSATLRRPADVVFAEDGRMFFADDIGGGIYWVAPTTLRMPGR